MKPSETLQRARALIEDPRRWCQGSLVDASGRRCAMGALHGVADICVRTDEEDYLEAAAECLMGDAGLDYFLRTAIARMNDTHGHAAAMKAYDIAISAALSDEAAE